MPTVFTTATGTHSHTNGTSTQTVFTLTPTATNLVKGIWLDFVNLTQNMTITLQYQIDGTNYRTFQTVTWTTSQDDGVLINGDIPIAADKAIRLQLTSITSEGASRDIPWERWTEGLGAGTVAFTYTLTNSVDSTPIAGAEIWVTTDAAGAAVVARGYTNASGQIVFRLDAGTVYMWRQHPDFSFTDPDIETVA